MHFWVFVFCLLQSHVCTQCIFECVLYLSRREPNPLRLHYWDKCKKSKLFTSKIVCTKPLRFRLRFIFCKGRNSEGHLQALADGSVKKAWYPPTPLWASVKLKCLKRCLWNRARPWVACWLPIHASVLEVVLKMSHITFSPVCPNVRADVLKKKKKPTTTAKKLLTFFF